MKGFLEFIKKQGVVGLAVGFILGGAVSKLVTALVNDLVNPILSVILGLAKGFETAYLKIGPIKILYGHFLNSAIDFLVIATIIYVFVKILKLDESEIKHVKKL
jgi:large conductance mechanosensitive channel